MFVAESRTNKTRKKRRLKMIFPSRSSSVFIFSVYLQSTYEFLLRNFCKTRLNFFENETKKHSWNSHQTFGAILPMCRRCVLGRVFVHKQTAQQKEKKNRIMPKQMARLRTTDTSRCNPPPHHPLPPCISSFTLCKRYLDAHLLDGCRTRFLKDLPRQISIYRMNIVFRLDV